MAKKQEQSDMMLPKDRPDSILKQEWLERQSELMISITRGGHNLESLVGPLVGRLRALFDNVVEQYELVIAERDGIKTRQDDILCEIGDFVKSIRKAPTSVPQLPIELDNLAPIIRRSHAIFNEMVGQFESAIMERDHLKDRYNKALGELREFRNSGEKDRTELRRVHWQSQREEAGPSAETSFSIVTPAFNGRTFLDETILSIVTQAGPFKIRYHVQDGGSTDGTLDLLARWSKWLSTDFPVLCGGIEFSYASAPDAGLYDAVNKGFAYCGLSDIMTWINSDDRYEQGAFASAAQIFQKFSDVDWIGSLPAVISEAGAQGQLVGARSLPREGIKAGIFDGRFSPHFLQQEGMFWRAELWNKVGGLNNRLQFAGDFDLWRRFAQHADFVMVDALLGCFRVREGQLSSFLDNYRREIDETLTSEERAARDVMAETFRAANTPETRSAAGLQCRIAENRVFAGGWRIVERV